MRRRVVGKRTTIPPEPFAFLDTLVPVKLGESIKDVEVPEAPEPSEGDTKKRRVDSFDEPVDWFQRERLSIAWLANSIFEIDVGDPFGNRKVHLSRFIGVAVKEIVRREGV